MAEQVSQSGREDQDRFERECYRFYSGVAPENSELLEWFSNPTASPPTLDIKSCRTAAELATTAERTMGADWVNQVMNSEEYYASCVEAKNRARSRAHLDKGAERRLMLFELAVKSQELWGAEEDLGNRRIDEVKRLLNKLLGQFNSDDSLIVLMRGVARLFELQMPSQECMVLEVSVDALSERSDEVKEAFSNFLCSVACLLTNPSSENRSAALRWRIKALISNRTLSYLARSIKESIAAKDLDANVGQNDTSTISVRIERESSVMRCNVDGVKDSEGERSNPCTYCCFSLSKPLSS